MVLWFGFVTKAEPVTHQCLSCCWIALDDLLCTSCCPIECRLETDTSLGQLTWIDQGEVSYHITSDSFAKLAISCRLAGHQSTGESDYLCITLCCCCPSLPVPHLFFPLFINCLHLNPWAFLTFILSFLSSPPSVSEQVRDWVEV